MRIVVVWHFQHLHLLRLEAMKMVTDFLHDINIHKGEGRLSEVVMHVLSEHNITPPCRTKTSLLSVSWWINLA
jgi:hypothetical protein